VVLTGYTGVLHGTRGVLKGYCPGTSGLLEGYSDGASGRLHARKGAKLEGRASALEGVLCGVLFAEGVLGADYTAGHSMQRTPGGSRRYSGGTQGALGWVLKGYGRALRRHSRSSLGVLEAFVRMLRGSQGVLKRHSGTERLYLRRHSRSLGRYSK
jgi:hypothetical protein